MAVHPLACKDDFDYFDDYFDFEIKKVRYLVLKFCTLYPGN